MYNAANGRLIHKFGSRGVKDHQFAGPHFVAVNSDNDIIVSDFHNHCIKVKPKGANTKVFFCTSSLRPTCFDSENWHVSHEIIILHLPHQVFSIDGDFKFAFGHQEDELKANAMTTSIETGKYDPWSFKVGIRRPEM